MSSRDSMSTETPFSNIVTQAEPMQKVVGHLQRIAHTESTVLICGESGTGKELAAAGIHQASERRAGPYVTVNMAAVPDALVESELFGHLKGSFTDASQDRQGCFEAADGGTLFIDEIGDLKLTSQAKLLRVLEEKRITPVGSNVSKPVDVRVIAATNRRLHGMVANREFREDLFYRLHVVVVNLPPLRDRPEDIPLLVDHFVDQFCQLYSKRRPAVTPELLEYLQTHAWPGNVRQLRNCVESMLVIADSEMLTRDDVPPIVHSQMDPVDLFDIPPTLTLEQLERSAVIQRLRSCNGNRTRAARSLDISVRTLQRRLKQWSVEGQYQRAKDNGRGRHAMVPGAS